MRTLCYRVSQKASLVRWYLLTEKGETDHESNYRGEESSWRFSAEERPNLTYLLSVTMALSCRDAGEWWNKLQRQPDLLNGDLDKSSFGRAELKREWEVAFYCKRKGREV